MQVCVYKTSGGKDIVSGGNYSPEGKAKLLMIFQILINEGLEPFVVRTINKNSRPKLWELKKDKVRLFFFRHDEKLYITHIVENKQKTKTELQDREIATNRIHQMIDTPNLHTCWL